MAWRPLSLDLLAEYPLGSAPTRPRRNVLLRRIARFDEISDALDRNSFAFHLAKDLEGRTTVPLSEGVWPINFFRCEHKFGNPGAEIFPPGTDIALADKAVYDAAFVHRNLCYQRLLDAEEARLLLQNDGVAFRYATELTEEWYDPERGIINVTNAYPRIIGSHSVPIANIVEHDGRPHFCFRNSWGSHWGGGGWGVLDFNHFDRFMIEAWAGEFFGVLPAYQAKTGIICLEWKWSINDGIGVFGREIIDAATSDRLAWAFCKKRGQYLDVEEFFVWPNERGKGYGRVLAEMVQRLARDMNRQIRMLVSYGDTRHENLANLSAAERLLGVELVETGLRAVHLVGTAGEQPAVHPPRPRPTAPAFMVELLRPRDEQPINERTPYTVFFGTNREMGDDANIATALSGLRGDRLILGKASVAIPRTPKFGSNGRLWRSLWRRVRGKHPEILRPVRYDNEEEFAAEVKAVLNDWECETHNLIYIHGYNTTFAHAIVQAARFGVDLKIPGQTFCFSWPSRGEVLSYQADEATVDWSVPFLREYVDIILRNTTQPLSFIVHSMGNRLLAHFLESIANEAVYADRIRHVILAAPDIDADRFRQAFARFSQVPHRTSLYTARADLLVRISQMLHGYHRAGVTPPVMIAPNLDTIRVEGFDLLDLGHDYYSEADSVLHDMHVLLRYDTEPSGRMYVEPAETENGEAFWTLARR